ncbi:MAG: 2-phosphosulfolactate phosphatase [candidate division Zixibacteria bacterium]|nr:2-phosphosulfolactate phosphatase [candidate division Zixibacteria bacterium]
MNIFTFFSHDEITRVDSSADIAVIFDVLRDSTLITAAFKAGASKIIPVREIDDAFKIANEIGLEKALICGAKDGQTIDGFDLGDSPQEFAPDKAKDKVIVCYSVNICNAIEILRNTPRVLFGCINNIQAIIDSIDIPSNIHLLCAGKLGNFAFEDAVCAGMFIRRIVDGYSGKIGLNDASGTSEYLYNQHHRDITGMMMKSSYGDFLRKIGRESDIEFAAQIDCVNIAPELSLNKDHILPMVVSDNSV